MAKKKTQTKMLRIKLVRSLIGNIEKHRATARSLGLTRMHKTVERPDSPALRGMLHKISHLITVEEVE